MSIRDDFFDKKNKAALWDVGVSINRTNPLPIDKNSVFDTIENLNTYVNGVLSYPGQVVALVTETETKVFYISIENNKKVLKQINTGGGSGIDITIIDNLTSESTTDALSAHQGKILNDTINTIDNDVYMLTNSINNNSMGFNKLSSTKLNISNYMNILSNANQGDIFEVETPLLYSKVVTLADYIGEITGTGAKYTTDDTYVFRISDEEMITGIKDYLTKNIILLIRSISETASAKFVITDITVQSSYIDIVCTVSSTYPNTLSSKLPIALSGNYEVEIVSVEYRNQFTTGQKIIYNGDYPELYIDAFNNYIKKDGDKVLSSNDYTNDAKTTVDGLGYSTSGNIIKYDLTKNVGSKDVHITSSAVNATGYISAGDVFTDNATIENIFIENTTGDFSSITAAMKDGPEEVKNLQSELDKKVDITSDRLLTDNQKDAITNLGYDTNKGYKIEKDMSIDSRGLIFSDNNKSLNTWIYEKQDISNLSTDITTDKDSDDKYPSVKAVKTELDNGYTPYPFWERNKRYNRNQIVCHDDETSGRIGFYKWTVSSEISNSDLDLTVPPYSDNNWEPISLKNALTDSDGNKITETYVKKSDIGSIEGGKTSLKDISSGGCISVIDCGFVNDGTTDNSAKLITVLEQYPNSTLYFPKGTYSFSSSIVFEHCHVILDSATLKYIGSETIDSFISVKGEILSEENETPLGGMFFVGIGNSHDNILDGNLKAKNIIRWTRQKGFQLKNIKICNFSESGIQTKWDIPNDTGENYSYESHISDCYIENNLIYSAYGIIENGGDAVVKDIVMLNVKKGILCGNSGTLYNNIHAWNYNWGSASRTAEENFSLMSETIFADVTVDGVRFINCYLDTCQKGFNMRVGVNSILVSNSFWYINSGTWITNLTPYVFYFVDGHSTTPKIYMSQCNIDNGCGLAFSNKTLDSDAAILLNTICEATGTPKTSVNLTKFSNNVNANNFTITNLPNPTEASQAANKSYIDATIQNAISELTEYVDTQIEENLGDKVECTGLTLSANSLTLYDGGTSQTLIATKEPTDCTQRIRWTTSNASVASVVNGVVTPKGYGNCVITAICGSYQANCSVNVLYAEGVYAKNFTPNGKFSYDLTCDFDAGQYVEFSIDTSKITDTTKSYLIFSLGNNITSWGSGYAVNDYYVKGTGVHNITVTYPTQESIDNYPNTSTVSTFVYQIKSDGIYLNNNKLEFSQSNAETFYNTVVNNWKSTGIVKFGNVIESDELGDITEVTYNYIKVVS